MDEKLKHNRLRKDINIAVQEILGAMDVQPIAILLSGSYGRNEGGWFEGENGNPEPYNDYDFSVIAESKLSATAYDLIRKKIAKMVKIKWIDIAFYKPSYFSKMKRSEERRVGKECRL